MKQTLAKSVIQGRLLAARDELRSFEHVEGVIQAIDAANGCLLRDDYYAAGLWLKRGWGKVMRRASTVHALVDGLLSSLALKENHGNA